jgi:plasmid stability protein
MASITIRNLDDTLKQQLRIRAAQHGRSMEEEARELLRAVLAESHQPPQELASTIRRRFAAIGGVELELPVREPIREPPDFS